MDAIPLVRTSQYLEFLDVFSNMGIPVKDYLKKMGLSEKILENPKSFMSEYPLWALVGEVSRLTDNNHIGFDVAEKCGVFHVEEFSEYTIDHSETLEALLNRFCVYFKSYSTSSQFWLEVKGEETWLCYQSSVNIDKAKTYMEQYYLMLMIEIVRSTQGDMWSPTKILCQYQNNGINRMFNVLSDSQFYFGQAATAIHIPKEMLNGPLPINNYYTEDNGIVSSSQSINEKPITTFVQSICEVLKPFLENEYYEMDVITLSNLIGIKPRTLQRRLAQCGLSYSQLLAGLRFDKAAIMLGSTKDVSIIDIAYSLGYSQPSHFTRAFRRWSGVSPKAFRSKYKSYSPTYAIDV